MKKILILLIFLISKNGFCQENKLIGRYINYNEFINITSDSLVEFSVDYKSCLAIPLRGKGEYKIKKDRLITKTSTDLNYESEKKKVIYFIIQRDSFDFKLNGPFYKNTIKTRFNLAGFTLKRMITNWHWHWHFGHCDKIESTEYKRFVDK